MKQIQLTNGKYGIPAEPKSTKNLANIQVENGVITAIASELAGNATMLYYMTEEGQEGRNAFNEKRKANFERFPKRP